MQKADQNENLEMDFAEFVQYMTEHEQKLKLAFSHLDRNKDGKLFHRRKNKNISIFYWLTCPDRNREKQSRKLAPGHIKSRDIT